jgi:membrane-associated phospholipid phosphatase
MSRIISILPKMIPNEMMTAYPATNWLMSHSKVYGRSSGRSKDRKMVMSTEERDRNGSERTARRQRRMAPLTTVVAGVASTTALGSTPVMTALTIALGIFLLRRGSWSHLAEMLVAIPLGTAALFVMKAFFQRARPVEALFEVRGLSFPSGHAFISVVFFGFIAYLLSRSQLHRIWIVAGASLCLVLIALIGTSRVYLGVHFLTDVVGGYSAGFLWLVFSLLLVRVVERGRSARRSGRDDPEGEPGVSGG